MKIKPGQNPSFRCEGWGRPVRLDTLGENDSRGVPLSVLKGEKAGCVGRGRATK